MRSPPSLRQKAAHFNSGVLTGDPAVHGLVRNAEACTRLALHLGSSAQKRSCVFAGLRSCSYMWRRRRVSWARSSQGLGMSFNLHQFKTLAVLANKLACHQNSPSSLKHADLEPYLSTALAGCNCKLTTDHTCITTTHGASTGCVNNFHRVENGEDQGLHSTCRFEVLSVWNAHGRSYNGKLIGGR